MTAPSPPVFETFGCRLNAYETEAMKELATSAGVEDAVVVNTCAVTAEAVHRAGVRVLLEEHRLAAAPVGHHVGPAPDRPVRLEDLARPRMISIAPPAFAMTSGT